MKESESIELKRSLVEAWGRGMPLRVILNRFLSLKEINKTDASVSDYIELLEAEFISKWEALIRLRNKTEQTSLFGTDNKKGPLL